MLHLHRTFAQASREVLHRIDRPIWLVLVVVVVAAAGIVCLPSLMLNSRTYACLTVHFDLLYRVSSARYTMHVWTEHTFLDIV